MAKKKNKVICRHGKKMALRSPLAIDSSELFVDSESGALTLSIIIKNTSSEDDPVFVESAGMVIRCLDAHGSIIVSGGKETISKTLKFPDEGIAPGAAVGIKTRIELSPDIVADYDMYIGCIRTSNLVVTDFVRGDFFDEPATPTLLSVGMTEEEIYDVCDTISDNATYYPDELSSLVWRCTCGHICDSDTCPECSAQRKVLFGFFADLVRPAPNAADGDNKQKRNRFLIAVLSASFFVISVVLILTLIFFLPDLNKDSDQEPTGEETEETLEEKISKIETALESKDYSEALEIALSSKALESYVNSISTEAAEYYLENQEFDIAYGFSVHCKDTAVTKKILTAGFDYFHENLMLDKAMSYATLLEDQAKINTIHIINIDNLLAENKFSDAIQIAIDAEIEPKKEEIILAAIQYYKTVPDYDTALEYALYSNKEEVLSELARDGAYYYLELDNVEKALEFAKHTNDYELMTEITEKLPDSTIRNNLGAFFKYLSFKRKQSIYASKVSVSKQLSFIASDRKVYYGDGQTYLPDDGISAVSVKSSAHHSVILLSDGSVKAFGDNSFGQCNVSSLKNVVAIDVGEYHTVALLADGTVKACGNREFSQCSVAGYENVIMIAAGSYHTLVLFDDGTVSSTGLNTSSQCNTLDWENITMISAGSLHSVALTSDGKVLAAGSKALGRCDVSSISNAVMVSAGDSHTLILLADGTITSCGGVVGEGNYGTLPSVSTAVYIDAGIACSAAITSDGKLVFAGDGLTNTKHAESMTVDPYSFFVSKD